MMKVGIVGASGFTGAELLRLCAGHPELEVRLATGEKMAGTRAAELYPSLTGVYPDLVFASYEPGAMDGLDLVFVGLPHGEAQSVVPELLGKVRAVVDLSADFRLKDASLYPTWYGAEHQHPELLDRAAFGLPELFRQDIRNTDLIAAPGCYVTAAALALTPLVKAGVVDATGVIVDAASGVSGSGRGLKASTAFCAVDEDFTAYSLLNHRHTPEIEQATGARVLFTPHLAPMNRGILATCYARPATKSSTDELLHILRREYEGEPFIVVSEASPSTKATLGSNMAHITARFDERTHWIVALCALDNLVKGASGQAMQCANLVLELDETAGLPTVGLYP
jgi:N-acetyl-gamma-glutamyl-phosphate reductase